MKKRNKIVLLIMAAVMCVGVLAGCNIAAWRNKLSMLSGSIKGNTYECQFYSNSGELFMTAEGDNINIKPNIVEEYSFSDNGWMITETMSSVITITIDGNQMESCGSTVLFVEDGLKPDVDFYAEKLEIATNASGVGDLAFIAKTVETPE